MTKKPFYKHVTIRNIGSLLPLVFDIEDGYRRGGLVKSEEGEYVALIGVSNIKADEPKMNYEPQEGEETISLCGMIIHNKREAEVLSEFFKYVAEHIDEQKDR